MYIADMAKKEVCRVCIVKRRGGVEEFDEKKVYASAYSAAMAGGLKEKEAEKLADTITKQLKKWLGKKKAVNSKDIFGEGVSLLKKQNKEVAFLYETHRDVS